MDDLTLRLDDNEELNALTLTTLLNSGVEEALSNLSPAQLIQLEKNVQKLKKQKHPTTPSKLDEDGSSTLPSKSSGKKRKSGSSRSRPTGGQYMNLPASTPHVEFRDGIEWLIFTYSTKGHVQEYHIRADIDTIGIDEIPDEFKAENCVYPRALVPREAYIGNRWDYESSVNDIAWKLCWRNPGVLTGKRGLIQRAVDSYRNRTPENRSRRVMRQEKISHSNPFKGRSHHMEGSNEISSSSVRVPGPKTMTLQYTDENEDNHKVKIRVDIDGVDLGQVDDDFRETNAIFPRALTDSSAYDSEEQWNFESQCNELGWKLAWLNSSKLSGKKDLIQKAVEAYQSRIEASERARKAVLQQQQHQKYLQGSQEYLNNDDNMLYGGNENIDGLLDKNEEFSQMVAHTLQQALANGPHGDEENAGFHFPDAIVDNGEFDYDEPQNQKKLRGSNFGTGNQSDDDHPNTVSTSELLRDL